MYLIYDSVTPYIRHNSCALCFKCTSILCVLRTRTQFVRTQLQGFIILRQMNVTLSSCFHHSCQRMWCCYLIKLCGKISLLSLDTVGRNGYCNKAKNANGQWSATCNTLWLLYTPQPRPSSVFFLAYSEISSCFYMYTCGHLAACKSSQYFYTRNYCSVM